MSRSKTALQFATTVMHLRRQQIASQVRNRLRPLYERPRKFGLRTVQEFSGCRWRPQGDFLSPGPQNNSVTKMLDGRFSFLNREVHIGWPPDWNQHGVSKLWLYNLHYFEYLWTLDYDQAKTIVLDWVENHPLRENQIGWDSYPTSLRLLNLCGVFFNKYRVQTEQDPDFLNQLWASISLQTWWLTEHLETHLLGNHLFENGAALAFVGSCFSGSAAERWLQLGKRILGREIPEQILSDGMHFERSPMYHCRIVYLLAMLYNTGHSELVSLVEEPLKKSLESLGKLTHPDGQITLLNDSAFAVYNTPAELMAYARMLLCENNEDIGAAITGPFALPDAGYYGFRDESGTYIVCDAAPIGPDYIPGHAHADIFTFELSLRGHRVIVDSGVYDYEPDSVRAYCRSTRAHNTLEIEGQDQCEMWAAFRVSRRGYPRDVRWIPSKNGFRLTGWHDGYTRLKGRPKHTRLFSWNGFGKLVIEDQIVASCVQNVVSRIHLHPDCRVGRRNDNGIEVVYPAGRFQISFQGKGKLDLEMSLYCPQFGRKVENTALAYRVSSHHLQTSLQVQELPG